MKKMFLFSIFIINFSYSMNQDSKTSLDIKSGDLKDNQKSKFLEASLKYGLVHGHEFVNKYVTEMTLHRAHAFSIPTLTLKNAKVALAHLISESSHDQAIDSIEIDYQKFVSQKFPIKVVTGLFPDKFAAQVSAIYLYYGIVHYNELRENILKEKKYENVDADTAFHHQTWCKLFPSWNEVALYRKYKEKFII